VISGRIVAYSEIDALAPGAPAKWNRIAIVRGISETETVLSAMNYPAISGLVQRVVKTVFWGGTAAQRYAVAKEVGFFVERPTNQNPFSPE
jgi:hypothetical protein